MFHKRKQSFAQPGGDASGNKEAGDKKPGSRRPGGFLDSRSYVLGLRWKMAFLLLAAFAAGGVVLYISIHTQLSSLQKSQITQELQTLRTNTEITVRQFLILNEANNDEASFRRLASEIREELYASSGWAINVLDREGTVLAKREGFSGETPEEDLNQAILGNAAFTMTYPESGGMLVFFSMPVKIEERVVGIIRYQVDKSALYRQSQETKRLVCQTAVAVFAAVLLLSLLLMGRVLGPIRELTGITRRVTRELRRGQVDMEIQAALADSRQKDEVGELSRNVSVMLETIGAQFQKMQRDQERILKLLRSRQDFFNNVTHELKTPLTTIQGYAQLLEADKGADSELLEQGVQHILQESTRLHRMVLQLLDMSDRSGSEEKKPVNLAEVARSVAQAMEVRAQRYGIHVRTELPEALWVMGLEERLRQVIVNLVDNAIKYGEDNSPIWIRGTLKGEWAVLAVWNRGKGLTEEQIGQIFEPFYRVDKAYSREQGSVGLGLSICQKIMKEHEGTISAKSRPGQQTAFFIRLKALEEVPQ